LITVLVLTIAAVTVYALADGPLSLFGREVKQASVKALFPSAETPVAEAEADSSVSSIISVTHEAEAAQLPEAAGPAAPDTSRQYILLTGDSMAEGLMFAFKKYAHYNGHTLRTIIWYGSTTTTWARTDTLKKLIARYKPSYVLLALGSNELFVPNIGDREPYIQDIVRQAGSTPFVWIGPPNWKEDTGIGELLERNAGPGRYFVSRGLTFERASDGRHPSRRASVYWADTISSWVMRAGRHPIRLDKPVAQLTNTQ
jgi:hypothetical protein